MQAAAFGPNHSAVDDGGKTWTQPGRRRAKEPRRKECRKAESNKVRVRHLRANRQTPHHSSSGTTAHRHPWESSSASGIVNLRPTHRSGHRSMPEVEDAGCLFSTRRWRTRTGQEKARRAARPWHRAQVAAPGRWWAVPLPPNLDPKRPGRDLHSHIGRGASATDDGGKTWRPINKGLPSLHLRPNAEIGHDVPPRRYATARARNVIFMQSIGRLPPATSRTTPGQEVVGKLAPPTRVVIDVNAHEPQRPI